MKKVTIGGKPTANAASRSPDEWVMAKPGPAEPMKRLTIDIPLSLHTRVKSQCASPESPDGRRDPRDAGAALSGGITPGPSAAASDRRHHGNTETRGAVNKENRICAEATGCITASFQEVLASLRTGAMIYSPCSTRQPPKADHRTTSSPPTSRTWRRADRRLPELKDRAWCTISQG